MNSREPARKLCRREFLLATTALAGGVGAGCASGRELPLPILDTHTHFYDPTRPQGVPWPPADDALLHRPVLPTEYRRLAEPLGVAGTVVVEASPWVEDNQWVLDLADTEPFLLGLVGHLKPGQPGFRTDLERFARHPRFRGVRTGLWGAQVTPENDGFVRDLALLSDRQLALDVLIGPDQLPIVARLAQRLPELRLVIDHCANLRVDGQNPPTTWREGLRACGGHRNVFLKVSGLVEGTGRSDGTAPRDVAFYRPVLEAAWEVFGEDRVVYGSNWPVSARFASLATVQGIVAEYVAGRGTEAGARFFHHNARQVYGLRRLPSWPRSSRV
jgi:L-fuconolactonase